MELIQELLVWTNRWFGSYGTWGLFGLAFLESIFFPVPVDALLIPMVIASPNTWLWLGVVAAVGSVTGAVVGYGVGLWGEKYILEKLFRKKHIDKVHEFYEKYEAEAILIAAFTPLPYKVFAVSAGVFYIDFKKFLVYSALGRTIRFLMVSLLTAKYGKPVVRLIDKYLLLTTSVVILLFAVYLVYKYYQRKEKKEKGGEEQTNE